MTTRGSEHHGLSTREAAVLLKRDGPNLPPQRPPTPLWRRIAGQMKDPLILVLLVAAALTAATRDWTDMSVILVESAGLLVDESALTGESVSIDKDDGDPLSAGTMAASRAWALPNGFPTQNFHH